jgi:hypothetical protein
MRGGPGRLAAWAGIGFVVVTLVSEVAKGDSPSPTGPADEIVDYLRDHRTGILAGAYLQMLGLFLFAVVVASAVERLWQEGRRREASFAALGAVLVVVAYTSYVFLTAALGFGAGPDAGPAVAKALWEIRFVAETFIAMPAALLVGSVAVAGLRLERVRRWYAVFSAVAAVAFLIGGAALARNGAFAPDGAIGFILFWLLPIWVAITGFQLRAPAQPQAARSG